MFFYETFKNFKNTYFEEHLRKIASLKDCYLFHLKIL